MHKLTTISILTTYVLFFTLIPNVLANEVSVATIKDLIPIVTEIKDTYNKKHPEIYINILNFKQKGLKERLSEKHHNIDIVILDNSSILEEWAEEELLIKGTLKKLGSDSLCVVIKKSSIIRPFMLYPETTVTKAIIAGNPYETALGEYTREALKNLNLLTKLNKKIIYYNTNDEIARQAGSSLNDGGIMYCSFAKRSFVHVTDILNTRLHSPIIYASAIARYKDKNWYVRDFNNFLKSSTAKEIMKKYHFKL
jgi:molybdenum ABC transporter molybdate-binding protein